ncbi:MAG TPA: LytTR family DNA-binding domain-containing protein [Kofleriaceae bacterium]|nr:LytTR family DNA-binding domain-containing protein [Kofleriaceae bacterium]
MNVTSAFPFPVHRTVSAPLPPVVAGTDETGAVHYVDANRVMRFWASNKYTVFIVDGLELRTLETLSSLELRLQRIGFIRIHRAELVQAAAVKALRPVRGDGWLRLSTGQVLPVSRRQLSVVRRALNSATLEPWTTEAPMQGVTDQAA